MRKTLNINLGGIAFIIDENAFELLHTYLESLKRKFKNETERNEILNDIESRIAEMLNQKLGNRKEVVTIEDVAYVTEIMGKPEDIAGEEEVATGQPTEEKVFTTPTTAAAPVKRRLFRDPDDAKVGGVISGLCHYFGINDPVWVRLAVALLCFVSFGTMILIYILLLIVIPKAMTSAEKLQMKGEPVNISTIEKEIKDAATRAGESIQNFGSNQSFISKLGNALFLIVGFFLKLIAAFVIFIGIIVLFALIAAGLGVTIAGNALITQAPHLLVDSTTTLTLFNIGLLLFIGAPIIGMIYAALRAILGNRGRAPWLKWTLLAAWWIGVFMLGTSAYRTGIEFKTEGTTHESMTLMQPTGKNIHVLLVDSTGKPFDKDDESSDWQVGFGGVVINGENLEDVQQLNIGKPDLQIMPSKNDSFYVEKVISSKGRNKGDAIKNASYAIYNLSQTDSVLNLPAALLLDKNNKWRAQNIKVRIAIPEGMYLSFGNNIDHWAATVKGDSNYDDTYFANTTWTVENGKIKCIAGENHFNAEKDEVVTEDITAIEQNGKKLKKQVRILKEKEDELKDKLENKSDKDDKNQDF